MSIKIQNILSRLILDSRGYPTIEAEVWLNDGSIGRASVPSGASTGDKEALEMRDNQGDWNGKGVNDAISNIEKHISPALIGRNPLDIRDIDQTMINLDGTNNKSKLGANAILAVSLANVKAGANSSEERLYQYINKFFHGDSYVQPKYILPIPMMNILNGGSHADNNLDIQEFMIIPSGFNSYKRALQAGVEIFHSLKAILKEQNLSTAIGDEGGFAPMLKNNEQALDFIMQAIQGAGYKPKEDVQLALDVAASELYSLDKNSYTMNGKRLTGVKLIKYYEKLCSIYPISSIEDGLDQNDWQNWISLNSLMGEKAQIVGDDLTVTSPQLLQKAIDKKAINSILIKLNQIGTFSETIKAIQIAQKNNLGVIISHRSGETEDTFISDLAIGTSAGQIKTGSLCRTDRTAKYNQLLRIEEYLFSKTKHNQKSK
tara:strand:- start:4116 stop:5408 length:1293 start_codon:yes stop_codon:yes gene_type:complete